MEGFIVDDASKRCRNCGARMPDKAKFCSNCGQKDTTGRIKLKDILHEIFETIFNIDNKTIRTLRALFIPGKLTNEFFNGRHEQYFRPLRIFFIMAILHFATITYVVNEAIEEEVAEQKQDLYSNAYRIAILHQIDTLQPKLVGHYDKNGSVNSAIDSLKRTLHEDVQDTTTLLYFAPSDTSSFDAIPVRISSDDLYTLPKKQILDKYEIEGIIPRLTVGQAIRVNQNLDGILGFIIGNFTWMILLMMPALALILKLLYIRRDYFYVEHLIFSFHYHAFAFLITSPAYLLVEEYPLGIAYAFGIVLIYLFVAMRRVYKQGVVKTGIKFLVLNNLYLFVLIFFVSFMVIISAALY